MTTPSSAARVFCRWTACLGVGAISAAAHAGVCDFSGVDAAVATMLARRPALAGAAVYVGTADGTLHQAFFGSYDADTVVPVASATKLLSGVAILTLADAGGLDLDAPVRRYLPAEFSFGSAGVKSTMTVRQMFAHTSGLPGDDVSSTILSNPTITLAEAVAQIACCVPLEDLPGDSFAYGGLSMHVGGRVAEVVSGQGWETFFDAALASPLGLTSMDYQGLGPTTNPRIAGGAQSNLADYARVLTMLLRGGEIDGVRILAPETVEAMMVDQTVGLPRRETPPPGAETFGYGFGGWVARTDALGRTQEFTSPGAFGFTPWVDLQRGVVGIIMVDGTRQALLADLDAIRAEIDAAVDACGPCPSDLNADGIADFGDVGLFLDAFALGASAADVNRDGLVDFGDVAAFASAFTAGC
jgi:CubicO group peptidase (beta-lactamase class C family)